MEEITRIIDEHKEALNRVLRPNLNQEDNSVCFGHRQMLKKPLAILLWIVVGISAVLIITALFLQSEGTGTVIVFLFAIAAICLLVIRYVTYENIIDLSKGEFEFKGQLRKNRTYTLADYEGVEIRRTIKDFPEEFRVKFKTPDGTKSYKLADLNMGYARNIEPNYEAVAALWDAIVKQMQSKDNTQLDLNNNQEVAPDTD